MRENKAARLKEKRARLRVELQKARADVFFIVYYDMGPERSLEKLQIYVAGMGLKRALNTFKRYSHQYDWQQRVVEEDTRRTAQEQNDADSVRYKMMDRHSKMGKTLQSLAMAGMYNFQEIMEKKHRLAFNPAEIVSMAKTGSDLELRAAGEPTLKVEITTILYNVMITRLAIIFQEVNKLPTMDAREARFAFLVDQYQQRALSEANELVEGRP